MLVFGLCDRFLAENRMSGDKRVRECERGGGRTVLGRARKCVRRELLVLALLCFA